MTDRLQKRQPPTEGVVRFSVDGERRFLSVAAGNDVVNFTLDEAEARAFVMAAVDGWELEASQ